MRWIAFIGLFALTLSSSAQGYYWQSAKKKQQWKYLTFGLGPGNRMYFGDVQQTGSLFNKVTLAYQLDARYQWKPRWGFAFQAGGRKYAGLKEFAYPGSYQELNGKLWEGQLVSQFSVLKWEDMTVHRFAGYDPVVKANVYLGAGFGGSLFNGSYETNYTSSSDSLLTINESASASGFAMYVPVEFGFRYRFTPTWSFNLEFQYHLYFSDNLDAVKRSLDDRMGLMLLKLTYSLGQPKKRV